MYLRNTTNAENTLAIVYLHSRPVYHCHHANIKNASECEDLESGFSFVAMSRIDPLYLSYNLIGYQKQAKRSEGKEEFV